MKKRKSPARGRAQTKTNLRQETAHNMPATLAAQYLSRRFGLNPLVAEIIAAAAGLGEREVRHG